MRTSILYFLYLLLISNLNNNHLLGQTGNSITDSVESKNFDYYAYPIVFYSPETNLAFGGMSIFYFRLSGMPMSKPSKVTGIGYYTINSQYNFILEPMIYLPENNYYIPARINYGKFIDKFYGVGNNTPEIDDPDYVLNSFGINVGLQYVILPELQVGFDFNYKYDTIKDRRKNPILNDPNYSDISGGISSGLGLLAAWDTRDNIFYPLKGQYFTFYILDYGRWLGSDFDYRRFKFDLRSFHSIINENHIFALQFYGDFTSDNVPFFDLPKLGGEKIMRGYFEGRFRDKKYLALQGEYRTIIFGDFGLVIFVGIGEVSPQFYSFKIELVKPSYGFGLRYRLDKEERIDLRADLGFGNGTSGIYFSIEQAF